MSSLATAPEQSGAHEELVAVLQDSVSDFCQRALDYSRLRELRDSEAGYDRALWREMAELGWLAVGLPEDSGGMSLGTAGTTLVARALGQVAAPEPFIETAVVALQLLQQAGADDTLVEGLTGGTSICVVAAAPNSDSPFSRITATKSGDAVQLHGSVQGVPLGTGLDAWLVPANSDGTPVWCFVQAGDDATGLTTARLSDGSVNAHLKFNGAHASIIASGELAELAWSRARSHGLMAASAYQIGLAETLLNTTREYVVTRKQFDKAIGSFQALQHRLVDCYLNLRVAIAVLEESVSRFDHADDAKSTNAIANRAMHRSGITLKLITREAIQLHGAMGYTDECDVGEFVNRALALGTRYGRAATHAAKISTQKGKITLPALESPHEEQSLADLVPDNGDWNALDNETFRQVVRQWHAANYPDDLKNLRYRVRWEQCRHWYEKLYRRGFAAPGWPTEHGGMGLSPEKLLIFIEERERLGVARTPDQGIIMVGPLLMKHGSPEQQAYYLPKALSGEHIWCQGYSEPNAGSDLASLKTSAVRDGDEFVINGQKIWTTMAQEANQMFCLVRTDSEARPQSGISFILIDFATPGITVRPITNIAGDAEFCEVFFDDVRVPCTNLVGEINQGWTIAKNLLSFERFFIGSPKLCRNALSRAAELAVANGLHSDPVTVSTFTEFELDLFGLEALYKSFADQIRRGEIPGPDVSLLKIFASEIFQELSEFILDLGGEQGAQIDGVETEHGSIDALFPYYHARPTTIYGGSNEIQRNILAKFVLQLPMS